MHGIEDSLDRLPTCGFFCEGHTDPSNYAYHTTALDYFGTDGPVGVTQRDGEPPVVSLFEMDNPQADFSPMRARQVAYQMLLAADVAERAAMPTVTESVTRMLAEVLAAAGHPAGAQ